MTSVTASAPAKVNLHLGVGALRPDGFHPVTSVFLALSLRDTVTVEPAEEWRVTLRLAPDMPAVEIATNDNIVTHAGRVLAARYGITSGAHVRVDKQIPVAAGLAGGSADAAAALVALRALWALPATDADLAELGAELGSDVPFSLLGGVALGTGRGEVLEVVETAGEFHFVLAAQATPLSTPAVYRKFDQLHPDAPAVPTGADAMRAALASGEVAAVAAALWNDLQGPAFAAYADRDLHAALTLGVEAGGVAGLVCGSGPTLAWLANDADHAQWLAERVRALGLGRILVAAGPAPGAQVVS